jgi:hypothetical protein
LVWTSIEPLEPLYLFLASYNYGKQKKWGQTLTFRDICDLFFETAQGIFHPLAIVKRHENTEDAQEAVGPIFLAGGLARLCLHQSLVDMELIKGGWALKSLDGYFP